ncbi:Modulator of FtsH protease HflK [compost metagenome]
MTRDRLYVDAMQGVLASTGKVLLDADGGNNLVYLPLDRLLDNARAAGEAESGAPGGARTARDASQMLETINAAPARARPTR